MSKVVKWICAIALTVTLIYLVKKYFFTDNMSTGKISDNGIKELTTDEKFVAKAYKDSAGKWTIGYGTLIDKPEEQYLLTKTISEAEARTLMRKDLDIYDKAVNGWTKVPLTQNQFDALVIFAYNVGLGAFQKSSLLKNLNSGVSKPDLAADFKKWIYITDPETKKKVIAQGLVNRRDKEINLFLA